jgi:hypothetical protein
LRVEQVKLTPIAVRDPPLPNAAGIFEPYALRSIIEMTVITAISAWANPVAMRRCSIAATHGKRLARSGCGSRPTGARRIARAISALRYPKSQQHRADEEARPELERQASTLLRGGGQVRGRARWDELPVPRYSASAA